MGKVLRQVGAFAAIAAVFAVANAASTLAGTPEVLARATAADRPAPGPNPPKGPASRPSFAAWIAGLKTEARTRRIGEATLTAALDGLRLNRRALELESRQPEFVTPVGAYVAALTGKKALATGRKKRRQHAALLARIEAAYGVPARYLLAIWRLESDYGANFGAFPVIETLATLAYAGTPKRRRFWRRQLFGALQIVDRGHAPLDRLVGSWAGAMGHTQFIPTTFLDHAVDFDGDGRRDLWRSLPDVFASTASYLRKSGWQPGLPFGWEAKLPEGFDLGRAHIGESRPFAEWRALGVRRADGRPIPEIDRPASLIVPAGWSGPVFLVTQNYRAILRYNNAAAYALTVGLFAERLEGQGRLVARWPAADRLLSRSEKAELQRKLMALGYDPGPVDGKVGPETRKAIRAFQKSAGKPADGYANHALLEAVREAAHR